MALMPFLISSARRVSRLASSFVDDSPSSYRAVGFSSLTRGLIGWLKVISIKAQHFSESILTHSGGSSPAKLKLTLCVVLTAPGTDSYYRLIVPLQWAEQSSPKFNPLGLDFFILAMSSSPPYGFRIKTISISPFVTASSKAFRLSPANSCFCVLSGHSKLKAL